MKTTHLALICSLLPLAGCNQNQASGYVPEEIKIVNAAQAAKANDLDYFPMARGNQWVYEVSTNVTVGGSPSRSDKQEMTFRCTNVYTQGDRTYGTLEAVAKGMVNERQQWILEKGKGLFQVSVGDPPKAFTPPQPAMRFPMKEGTQFKWEGHGFVPDGTSRDAKMDSVVQKNQEVDTDAGRMMATPILSTISWATGRAAQTTWWAPGVGIARYRQEVVAVRDVMVKGKPVKQQAVAVSTMRLVSTTLKKAE